MWLCTASLLFAHSSLRCQKSGQRASERELSSESRHATVGLGSGLTRSVRLAFSLDDDFTSSAVRFYSLAQKALSSRDAHLHSFPRASEARRPRSEFAVASGESLAPSSDAAGFRLRLIFRVGLAPFNFVAFRIFSSLPILFV